MEFKSRTIALIVSVVVAAIFTTFLYFAPYLSVRALVITLGLTFSVCFILIYFSFEILIFREINNIYTGLEHIKRKEFRRMSNKFLFRPDPLKRIKDEILYMAEQKQKEIDELMRLQVLRREFLADVSHELKTPIFAAQGFIHTLLDGAVDDENVRDKFLQKAAKSLDGLDNLVQDLISISQLEKGVVKMQLKSFDIGLLCLEVFEELEQKATTYRIRLHLESNPQIPLLVYADPNRIKQVLVNLIDNAIKYGRPDGNIWVKLMDTKKKVTVSVTDDGPGIAEEHKRRVFERFYRIDKSRSRESGGSGLGLAISKHILEAHRTTIELTSELEQGTSMRFRLSKPKA
ncbi:MAG: alkaline phosphatase [Adhaeribacter sp.]|jgi:two-component system phosphate regulon sensor histidine kinase PhoR|nr:alkaline phosphatase [Adhaeribacter sp.]